MTARGDIYKHHGRSAANNGISDNYDEVVIVAPDFEGDAPANAVKLVAWMGGVIAVPANQPADKPVGPMAGGSFITAYAAQHLYPDFRDLIRYGELIRLHDRFESWELYDALSR